MSHAKQTVTAVLLHLANTRHLDDFTVALDRLRSPRDLFVNLVRGLNSDSELDQQQRAVVNAFPDARIIVSENRGMDVGGMLRLFEHVHLGDYRALLYLHGKSDEHWRRAMLDVLTRNGESAMETLCRATGSATGGPVGMIGAYLYPFDYFNIGPFLDIARGLNIPLQTSWDRYFTKYPAARALPLPQRIAHALDRNARSLRPELDLEYARYYLGDLNREQQPMTQHRLKTMIADQVVGPLPYFPGNFFWISIQVVRALAQRINFEKEFKQLPMDLNSDTTHQSRAHAWERILPVFAAKSGFRVVALARQA
jgi:lipopolysaccharide biosynthesis protein